MCFFSGSVSLCSKTVCLTSLSMLTCQLMLNEAKTQLISFPRALHNCIYHHGHITHLSNSKPVQHLWLWILLRSSQGGVCFRVFSQPLSWHQSKNSILYLGLNYCDVLFVCTVTNRPVSMAAPGNQIGPRVTLIKGRHQTCKITVFYHELTTDDVVLNTRMPRASIIHDTASPPNQLYWVSKYYFNLLAANEQVLPNSEGSSSAA